MMLGHECDLNLFSNNGAQCYLVQVSCFATHVDYIYIKDTFCYDET